MFPFDVSLPLAHSLTFLPTRLRSRTPSRCSDGLEKVAFYPEKQLSVPTKVKAPTRFSLLSKIVHRQLSRYQVSFGSISWIYNKTRQEQRLLRDPWRLRDRARNRTNAISHVNKDTETCLKKRVKRNIYRLCGIFSWNATCRRGAPEN